jgi:hypothetical protein
MHHASKESIGYLILGRVYSVLLAVLFLCTKVVCAISQQKRLVNALHFAMQRKTSLQDSLVDPLFFHTT